MNVLITGGAGYVGTELLARLALNKEITKITIYDNLSRCHRSLFLGKKVPFFYLGPKNDWRQSLDTAIIKKIEKAFKKEMEELGYL